MYMYIYIYVYVYVCICICVYIYTHDMQTSSANQLVVSECAFRRVPCQEAEMAARREEEKRLEEEFGSCAKALHGAAFLELWASLGITGHHWATLSQYVEQYVTTHSQVKMLNTFEHLVAELSSDLDVMHLCTGCLGNYIVFQCLSCSQPALEALECPTSLTCFDIFRILPTLSVLVIYSRRAEEEARLGCSKI